jgi:hypothetical protein
MFGKKQLDIYFTEDRVGIEVGGMIQRERVQRRAVGYS